MRTKNNNCHLVKYLFISESSFQNNTFVLVQQRTNVDLKQQWEQGNIYWPKNKYHWYHLVLMELSVALLLRLSCSVEILKYTVTFIVDAATFKSFEQIKIFGFYEIVIWPEGSTDKDQYLYLKFEQRKSKRIIITLMFEPRIYYRSESEQRRKRKEKKSKLNIERFDQKKNTKERSVHRFLSRFIPFVVKSLINTERPLNQRKKIKSGFYPQLPLEERSAR
ncbi:hypothetical protein M0813_29062 [Anaeramoeba flamelloides]|uniref:Uncharacterized protein n=1 Tax=Anaeramoeba flamelloides TaxID=1746091 RepID=A0ABQ8XSZ4_9EUKA|nr:hypothetical protein M0813_29062 [Anaeramoeba flamelloides]